MVCERFLIGTKVRMVPFLLVRFHTSCLPQVHIGSHTFRQEFVLVMVRVHFEMVLFGDGAF